MVFLNSSHCTCRREAQSEIDRATAMAAPGLLLSVVHQRGWAGQYRGAYLAMVSPGERRCRPGKQVTLVVPVLAIVGFTAEALRPASHPPSPIQAHYSN